MWLGVHRKRPAGYDPSRYLCIPNVVSDYEILFHIREHNFTSTFCLVVSSAIIIISSFQNEDR